MDQAAALATLQRVGRGVLGKRAMWRTHGLIPEENKSKWKVQRMVKRVRFMKRIQPICKGYLTRRDLIANLRAEAERPIKVMQRFGRAFRVRRETCHDLARWKERRRKAATTIQAFGRMKRSRMRAAVQFRRQALRVVQCVGRGLLHRYAAFDLIVKRLRKRQKQVTLLQGVGRAMLVRTDAKYQRRAQIRERRRVFVFETMRIWKAYRIRLSLGRRRRVVLRARQMRLACVMQRVGQGFFDRRFLKPKYDAKKRADWLDFCAALIQRCGRGLRARDWLGYQHAAAQARIRRNRVKRQAETAAALTLQRVGRGFKRRQRCFRRFFKLRLAMVVIAAVARGAMTRVALGHRFKRPTHRVREVPEAPEGEDERALRVLRAINQALRDELMEEQWRIDTLLTAGVAVALSRAAVAGDAKRNPVKVYEARIAKLRESIARLRQRLGRTPPEYLASLTTKLTDAERDRARLVRERRKMKAELERMAPDVADADRELGALDEERAAAEKDVARLRKRAATADEKAAKAQAEQRRIEARIAALELKEAMVVEFDDEDRPTSARTLRRRREAFERNVERRLEGSQSIAAGSPRNAARGLAPDGSLVSPPSVLRGGGGGELSLASFAARPGEDPEEAERRRLTYHFGDDGDAIDLAPRRAASSLAFGSPSELHSPTALPPPPPQSVTPTPGLERTGTTTTLTTKSMRLLERSRRANAVPDPLQESKLRGATNPNVGICVPMVSRMDYGFGDLGRSVRTGNASALRGAAPTLVGSPIRSIRVKSKGSALQLLSPEAPRGHGGGGALEEPGSMSQWSGTAPHLEGVPTVTSISIAHHHAVAGDGGDTSASVRLPRGQSGVAGGAPDARYQPHIVVRTRADLVYAKMQLQEADTAIESLKFEVDKLAREVEETRERWVKAQEDDEAKQRREERRRRRQQQERLKREAEDAEDARLRQRLATIQAIAAAEKEAADAAARRAEAEARLRSQHVDQQPGKAATPPPPRVDSDADTHASFNASGSRGSRAAGGANSAPSESATATTTPKDGASRRNTERTAPVKVKRPAQPVEGQTPPISAASSTAGGTPTPVPSNPARHASQRTSVASSGARAAASDAVTAARSASGAPNRASLDETPDDEPIDEALSPVPSSPPSSIPPTPSEGARTPSEEL